MRMRIIDKKLKMATSMSYSDDCMRKRGQNDSIMKMIGTKRRGNLIKMLEKMNLSLPSKY